MSHRHRSLALAVALLCAPGAARAVDDGGGSFGQPGPEVPPDPCATDPADPACDQDADGLTNAEEDLRETNLTDADTDDDGLLDGDEVSADNALDPCEPSADALACDEDRDGLTNAAEDALGTWRSLADTDGDDVLDGADESALDPCLPSASAAACTPASDAEEPALDDEAALDDVAPEACANGADASGCDVDADGVTGAVEQRIVSDAHGNLWMLGRAPLGSADDELDGLGEDGPNDEDSQGIDVSGGGLSCAQSSAKGNAGVFAMLGLVALVRSRRSRAA